jgi:hypothetical protein
MPADQRGRGGSGRSRRGRSEGPIDRGELGCGATEIRTPDLLHAMEPLTVRHSPLGFTRTWPDLRERSGPFTRVHPGTLRTVTSLVTSRSRPAPVPDTPAAYPRTAGAPSEPTGARADRPPQSGGVRGRSLRTVTSSVTGHPPVGLASAGSGPPGRHAERHHRLPAAWPHPAGWDLPRPGRCRGAASDGCPLPDQELPAGNCR